jgi:hypothetical protein
MIKLAAVLTAILVVASFALGKTPGLIGMLLGISMGAFGAYTLYAVISLLKDAAGRSRTGIALIIVAFFAKFPVIGLGAYLSYRFGIMSLACFVAGVLVVYCGLVWRASRHGLYPH